jgi:hypothetical protein
MSKIKEELFYQLSNYGWYVSANLKLLDVLSVFQSIQNNTFNEKEHVLIDYYKNNLNDIESKLLKKHLDRNKIISEAFIAHKNKMFNSSTILFISQSDGICEGKIFSGNKKKDFFDSKKSPYFVKKILLDETAINENTWKEVSNYFSELNRHKVMHGLTSDYGNEINSLKALSLLCFVSDWVDRDKE